MVAAQHGYYAQWLPEVQAIEPVVALARRYAADKQGTPVSILVAVGTKDQNYEPNLDWMAHLTKLGIPFEKIIVPDTPHSAREVYRKRGLDVMRFHAANFRRGLGREW